MFPQFLFPYKYCSSYLGLIYYGKDKFLSFSAVRYGRVPKRSRERGPEDNVATTTTSVGGGVQQLTSATNNNNTSTNNNNVNNNNNNNSNSNNNNNINNNNNSQAQNVIPRVPSAAVVEADQSDADGKQLAVYDVILQVSQAHHAHCGFTEESTRGIVRKPMIIPVSFLSFHLVHSYLSVSRSENSPWVSILLPSHYYWKICDGNE